MLQMFKKSFDDIIHERYEKLADVKYAYLREKANDKGGNCYLLIFHDYLSNFLFDNSELYTLLKKAMENRQYSLDDNIIPGIQEIKAKSLSQIDKHLFSGDLVLFSNLTERLYAIPCRNYKTLPFEKQELLSGQNVADIALIRDRIKSYKLKNIPFNLGDYTKTAVNLLYIDPICDSAVSHEVKDILSNIRIDALSGNDQLENILSGNRRSLVPLLLKSDKASECTDALLEGKFVVLGNNLDKAIIGPADLGMFVSNNSNQHYLSTIVDKTVKLSALMIGVLAMGLIAALYCFNPELLPYILINNVINARKGIFIGVEGELIAAELLLQIFRIAAIRKPSTVGLALIITAGVITGFLTTASGLIGPDIMIVAALSFIAVYLVSSNHGFTSSIYLFRILILIFSMLFGLAGFTFCAIFAAMFFITKESFGIPFMAPLVPFNLKKIFHSLLPKSYYTKHYRLSNLEDGVNEDEK